MLVIHLGRATMQSAHILYIPVDSFIEEHIQYL